MFTDFSFSLLFERVKRGVLSRARSFACAAAAFFSRYFFVLFS